MATSGVYTFNPTIGEMIEEACERAEVGQTAVIERSARRSINLMFTEWANKGPHQWAIVEKTAPAVEDQKTYTLDPQSIDIMDMVLNRGTFEFPMTPIGRQVYLEIPTKTYKGRPDRYFMNRQGQDGVTFTVWQVPENSTDIFKWNEMRRLQTAVTPEESADVDHLFFDALCAGLASRLSLKFNAPKYGILKPLADEALLEARAGGRERAPTRIRARFPR